MMSILRFFRRPKAPVPLARRPTESELHVSRILAEPRISPGVLTDLEIFNSTTGGDALSALAELKIRSAIREGLLDEIQGRGKPLAFFESPFVTPHDAAMNRIMIKNGAVPDWIGAGSLIEKEAGELRRRMRREWEARKRYADTFDGPWKNELANRVESLNLRIRHYNLIFPAPFLEKASLVLEDEVSKMLYEMPPVERPRPKTIECW